MEHDAGFHLFEITTDIEGDIKKEIIDVNAEDTIIQAIEVFKKSFPTQAKYITDVQLVTGAGRDDLTILLLGNKLENINKAFKVAYNLLSPNQRYAFNRTPDIISMIKCEQNNCRDKE
jgi:hypothetical protein